MEVDVDGKREMERVRGEHEVTGGKRMWWKWEVCDVWKCENRR